jgi:amino acid permease
MKPVSESSAEKKRMPWSNQFFIGAAIFAAFTTLEIIIGQRLSKYHPHSIDRIHHLGWYLLPLCFCLFGFAFRAYEKRKNRNPSQRE